MEKRILKRGKGFTLIELIAVLVIMAIIALIVTPVVMNIIRKARVSADKRSVDAYGRSIELAIAGYLLDTGKFPTEVSQLTIEYSGSQVVCSTTQINTDSSVYLAGCTVAGRSVDNYTYGSDKTPQAPTYTAYQVGDEVTYNNVDYYVIKDSDTTEESVTLLKAEPLKVAEVNQFGAGHVNMYNCYESESSCYHTAYDNNGYGGMTYYTSVDCGYGTGSNNTETGCKNDYASSEVKYVVDAWKAAKAPAASEARLISKDEIETERKEYDCCGGCGQCINTGDFAKYDWTYNNNYWYWTNTPYTDSSSDVWYVNESGRLGNISVGINDGGVVRPVITISKSNISNAGN